MSGAPWDDAFEAVRTLEDLTTRNFRTPAAGARARPFKVSKTQLDGLEVTTSRGGTIQLRAEAFAAAVKVLHDLGEDEAREGGWVPISDELLVSVLQAENHERACSSYVLPLLVEAGKLELDRGRPARARLARPGGEGA
ncbi:MAG: hypothetical protein KDD82_22490 [Planctomycetes bacterium]|nr:hypothetical protein [Planctomycetota bacterium]